MHDVRLDDETSFPFGTRDLLKYVGVLDGPGGESPRTTRP